MSLQQSYRQEQLTQALWQYKQILAMEFSDIVDEITFNVVLKGSVEKIDVKFKVTT